MLGLHGAPGSSQCCCFVFRSNQKATYENQVCKIALLKAWQQIIFPTGTVLHRSRCSETLGSPAQLRFFTQPRKHFLHPFTRNPCCGAIRGQRTSHTQNTSARPQMLQGGRAGPRAPHLTHPTHPMPPAPQQHLPEHPRVLWLPPTSRQRQPVETDPCPIVC